MHSKCASQRPQSPALCALTSDRYAGSALCISDGIGTGVGLGSTLAWDVIAGIPCYARACEWDYD